MLSVKCQKFDTATFWTHKFDPAGFADSKTHFWQNQADWMSLLTVPGNFTKLDFLTPKLISDKIEPGGMLLWTAP